MTESAPFKIGVVGLRGGWSSEALASAFEARTGFRLLIELDRVVADMAGGRVYFSDVDLTSLDAIVVKKAGEVYSPEMLDRLELLRFVEGLGVPVFSKPETVLRLIDRMSCTVTLAAAGLPVPPTVITEDTTSASAAIEGYGSAVVKPLYSTKARGMELLDRSMPDLDQRLRAYQDAGNRMLYVQKRLPLADRDYGAVFVGEEYVGTYARVKSGDTWNTTIHAGGSYARHEPSTDMLRLARRARALFDLAFTSVDLVETNEGLFVFEVSAFGGFRGVKEGLGLDAASLYADYVLSRLKDGPA